MAVASTLFIPDRLTKELDDDCYQNILRVFSHAGGKGRPPKLQSKKVTNKLLLQLFHAKEETGISWVKLEDILQQSECFKDYPRRKYRGLLQGTVKHAETLCPEKEVDLQFVGVQLEELGIKRHHLEDLDALARQTSSFSTVTKGMVVELELHRQSFNKTLKDLSKWLAVLGKKETCDPAIPREIYTKYQRLQKDSYISQGASAIQTFCNEPVFLSSPLPSPDPNQVVIKQLQVTKAQMSAQIKHLCDEKESSKQQMRSIEEKLAILNEDITCKNAAMKDLHMQLENCETKLSNANKKVKCLSAELKTKEDGSKTMTREAWSMNLMRRERALEALEAAAKQHRDGNCEETIERLHAEIKRLQGRLGKIESENEVLRDTIDSSQINIRTREENSNKFTSAVRKCVMKLAGDAEIPAAKIGHVIGAVCKELCNVTLLPRDLPSERTCLRILDAAHVLSNVQVCTAILEASNTTLHSDGTSRDHRKFMGHQFVTSDGQMLSAGFTSIAQETAVSLLDVLISLLRDLSDAYASDEQTREHVYLDMVTSITSTMSDRAKNMKSFALKFSEYRQEMTGQPSSGLEVLHCNAHFLLGLSVACEEVLKEAEPALGKLGRDQDPQFQRYHSTDSATNRYIRTACEVLGPRGDEKNGCKAHWEAFCSENGITSAVTSFRSNRFNNFFMAAAALHSQRALILDFLQHHVPTSNRKIISVCLDSQDNNIDSLVIAVGILYVKLTGPYWMLLHSNTQYLQFHTFVESMESSLKAWIENPDDLLDPQAHSVFPGFRLKETGVTRGIFNFSEDQRPLVASILVKLSEGCLKVVRRQLVDFLPGGLHHNVQDPERKEKLKHSSLTNLFGEQCFGDLDFSVFKRRNASVHHHSTLNSLKRNKTMDWLDNHSHVQQEELLQESGKKAQRFRDRSRQSECDTITQLQRIQEARRLEAQHKKEVTEQKKMAVVRAVREQGGPCLSKHDVDRLVAGTRSKVRLRTALRNELQYNKLVLGSKSKLLKLTGSLTELTHNLKLFLGADNSAVAADDTGVNIQVDVLHSLPDCNLPDDKPGEDQLSSSTRSVKRSLYCDSDDTSSCPDTDDDNHSRNQRKRDSSTAHFRFREESVDQFVAVFYDQTFYLGRVLEVSSEIKATVTFLEPCGLPSHASSFRWPVPEDIAEIDSMYVFYSGFLLKPMNSRLSVWSTDSIRSIKTAYAVFKEQYC